MGKVPLRVHLSSHEDETSELSHWHIPESHFLESWSDARAFDGTVSIVQPLIAPLYATRSAHELLATMGETPEKSAYDSVREYWLEKTGMGGGDDKDEPTPAFEAAWRRWLHDGVMADTALPARAVTRAERRAVVRCQSGAGGRAWRSRSATIRVCSTAGSPTTDGCRSCPSRLPS